MKYAVVTGSTSGIGFAIAKKLISKDYFVFINGRNEDSIDLPPDKYMFIKADVSCEEGIHTLVSGILSKTQKIDCLVLNAGGTCKKKLSDTSLSEWRTVMSLNVDMPFLLIQMLLNSFNENGSILFISSALALKPHATSLPYGVSKAAVNALAQGLVKEVAPYNIRVNSVCPGFVDTEWQKEKPLWLREKITSKIALNRFALPEEVADMCVCVMENSYMNGAVVSIDGGYDME